MGLSLFCEYLCKKYKDGCVDDYCPRKFRLNYLCDEALLTDAQRQRIDLFVDKDNKDRPSFVRMKEIENNIEDFVNKGESLYIHSPITGNGKTAWSVRLLMSYIFHIWYKSDMSCRALFINVPRLFIALKDNISRPSEYIKHIKENVLTADIVVWDEIGTKATTEFESENLFNFINARIDAGKSNIYTSNASKRELSELLGKRLYSRIVTQSEEIELYGRDKRNMKK